MVDVYLTNTLSRKKEKFIPVKDGEVGIYSCGPTVYWNQHIGNMYAYVQWDTLVRFFRYLGLNVKWVMNITDVGHMTSDEDTGQDKMEKGAKRENVSVWQIADKYIKQFTQSMSLLNNNTPDVMPRATKHIDDQINLIKLIEENGFTYKTDMGLVFDTAKFPDYAKFANLNLESQRRRKDVEQDAQKKRPWDFLLWVTGNPKHIMLWDSPWGKGYPGWHIECTAMSTKYLGNNFDIHTGGVEHIAVHHTNEIAQGFAAFGKQTANYWLHNGWLTEKGGEKVSKSKGGFATVQDLVKRGYDPLSLRYLFLSSNYKTGMQFSFEALDSADTSLRKIKELIKGIKQTESTRESLSPEKMNKIESFKEKFIMALADDFNLPVALSVIWEVLKNNIPSSDKLDLILSFDEVLGLKLSDANTQSFKIPEEVEKLVKQREELRNKGNFLKADELRKEIRELGFLIDDTSEGTKLKPAR